LSNFGAAPTYILRCVNTEFSKLRILIKFARVIKPTFSNSVHVIQSNNILEYLSVFTCGSCTKGCNFLTKLDELLKIMRMIK